MKTQFALDLRLARKKAGLRISDCAHLIGRNRGVVTLLEQGRRTPTLTEICTLSLIYGRSFESLFAEIMRRVRRDLTARLETLSDKVQWSATTANRSGSLERLKQRLAEEACDHDT